MNNAQNSGTYLELKNGVESIANKYFQSLKSLSKSTVGKSHTILYIKKVKAAYSKLDSLEQRIINNEFFFQEYPDWWKKTYTKTTFYRLKKQSMKDFLEAFKRVK